MATARKKLCLANRISNAFGALFGDYVPTKASDMTVSLDVDTSKLEEGLARAKARIAEFEAANKLPAPRLMVKTDRKLSQESYRLLAESVRLAVESDKAIVFGSDIEVYQLIAGQWQPIDTTDDQPVEMRTEMDEQDREKLRELGMVFSDEANVAVRKRRDEPESP